MNFNSFIISSNYHDFYCMHIHFCDNQEYVSLCKLSVKTSATYHVKTLVDIVHFASQQQISVHKNSFVCTTVLENAV